MEKADVMQDTMTSHDLDQQKLEKFLGKVVSDFGSSLSTTLSFIGDKLGLYKAMAFAGPMTSTELAEKTGTTERYVHEWLINQAAGGYVEYDAETGRYFLPDEHAVALTDENSPFFVSGVFQLATSLQKDEERITHLFETGEGMLWGEHHHGLFQATERFFKPSYHGNLLQLWLPALDGITNRLTEGIAVADIGCGHGISTLIMARAFPASNFVGYDNHAPSIERANALAQQEGLRNVRFEVASAQDFPATQLGFITYFDCLHDMGDPIGALRHAYESLAPDGIVMLVEPMAGKTEEENFNPVGRVYSGASVLVCSPNAMASGGYVLGTVASDAALEEVARNAGFTRFRRATETVFNRIFELKK